MIFYRCPHCTGEGFDKGDDCCGFAGVNKIPFLLSQLLLITLLVESIFPN